MGLWERWVAIGEVVKDSRMMPGGEGWMCASLGCLNAWGSDLGDPCVVGLCRHPETMERVDETCRGSPYYYGGQGVHTEVARCI